jgi:hypothetical protein
MAPLMKMHQNHQSPSNPMSLRIWPSQDVMIQTGWPMWTLHAEAAQAGCIEELVFQCCNSVPANSPAVFLVVFQCHSHSKYVEPTAYCYRWNNGNNSLGVIFYFCTVVGLLKSLGCPFQIPVSMTLNRVLHTFQQTIRVWAHQACSKSWASTFSNLQGFPRDTYLQICNRDDLQVNCLVSPTCLARIWSALRQTRLSLTDDPESIRDSDESISFKEIDLYTLNHPADPAGAHSIQWILETSTDMDIITMGSQAVLLSSLGSKDRRGWRPIHKCCGCNSS